MLGAISISIVLACGDGGESSGETEGATGGMPTTTEGTTMSGGPTTTSPTSDTMTTSAASTGEASTGEPPDTGSPSGSGSSGEPASGSTDGTSSGSDGGSSSGTSAVVSTDTGTTGGIMSQACADGCVVEFQCGLQWSSAEECTEWCNANLAAAARFSPFCMLAWEELSECLGTLDCKQYAQWEVPMMFPYPCSQQDDALAFECDGQ